jgi:DNA polymerase
LAHAGLRREDVYIANVLKCRPPGNRDPEPFEIETCTPFLREQMRVISPEVIVTLGKFASQFVLRTDESISRLRGSVRQAGRFTVLPIYHPAAAIYDRTKADVLFADFECLRGLLERTKPDAGQIPGTSPEPDAQGEPQGREEPGEPAVEQGTLF